MQNEPVISFRDVCFSYQSEHLAIQGASFDIFEGETVCFIGKNGSGKSTAAKLMNGLLIPDSGTVRTFGKDTSEGANAFSIRSRTGFVFQNPTDQIVSTIVEAEVAFGPENQGLSKEEIRQRVDDALERVGMSDKAKSDVNTLSGGQLQRTALADTLAMMPDVLILDEPTSMLDPSSSKAFLDIVRRLKEEGKTIVMITHSKTEALLADRLIAMDQGRIVYDGLPQSPILDEMFPALPTREELRACALENAAPASDERLSPRRKTIISFEDVSFSYNAPKKRNTKKDASLQMDDAALKDIHLSIAEGETVCIMGSNGSGKSTLIKHMNGLLRPTVGKVIINGASTSDKQGANAARRIVGECFQYPERQLFAQSVYEDVAFGPAHAGLADEKVDEAVREALKEVSLAFDAYAGKNPFKLSGGEQRRVALAGVLAMKPRVLVMDEPCAGLDPQTHIEFLRLIARLKASDKTIVIVTHDEREAELLGDRIVCMDNGRIATFHFTHHHPNV